MIAISNAVNFCFPLTIFFFFIIKKLLKKIFTGTKPILMFQSSYQIANGALDVITGFGTIPRK